MTMMDVQLNSWLLFDHAEKHHADTEVVSRLVDGSVHRYTYRDFARRAQQLMHVLDRLGIGEGERVATLAWNSYRHLECYFGIPCANRILHTLNLRLSPAELGWIIADADDRAILVDADLLPLLEQVPEADRRGVSHFVVLADRVPETSLPNVVAYDQLLAAEPAGYERREIDERTPLGICYTSGTTGRPKGVVYTHRSTFLHSLAASSTAAVGIGPQECALPIVPMFHANAWGMPHAAVAVGAKQVFYAGAMEPAALLDLMAAESVTICAGVPTVFIGIADELARRGGKSALPALKHVLCGGSQPPKPLIERYLKEFGIYIAQGWGMTETSPVASVAWPKFAMRDWPEDRLINDVMSQAGLPLPAVNVSIRDAEGKEVPADGKTMGQLLVRGPWVAGEYWKGAGKEQFTDDGWFMTGDVAVANPDGYFVIADRTKDLVKSGGEWISSVDMEGDVMAMPEVVEAAVIAVPDPKWQERPLVAVVPRAGATVTAEMVRDHLEKKGWAKWQLPERVETVEAVPKTSVGKFDKKVLRAKFVDGAG